MSDLSHPARSRRWGSWVPVVLLAVMPLVTVRAVDDASPWLHLKVGQYLIDGGRFGLPDPWAPMATHTYIPTQWLPSVVMAMLYDGFGTPSIVWSRGVGIVVLAVGILWTTRAVARTSVALAVTALTVAAAWAGLSERPQLLGFILLVPVVGAWWRTAMDHRARWWLVPLTWLAASCHGVWSLGLVVGAVVTAGLALGRQLSTPQWRRLVGVLLGSTVAAGLTPLGPKLLLTPFTVGSNGRQFVTEWFPSSVRTPGVALTLALLLGAYAGWLATRRRPPAWQLLTFLAAIALTLVMQRTVAVGAFLAAPLLAQQVEHMVTVRRGPGYALSRLEVWSWVVGVAVASLVALPLTAARSAHVHAVPEDLAGDLRRLPAHSRIIADGDVTGWVLFTAPQVAPVFDLRIESYDPHYVERYISALQARPGWESFIADGRATTALLPTDSALGLALVEQLHWRVLNRADGYQVLESTP